MYADLPLIYQEIPTILSTFCVSATWFLILWFFCLQKKIIYGIKEFIPIQSNGKWVLLGWGVQGWFQSLVSEGSVVQRWHRQLMRYNAPLHMRLTGRYSFPLCFTTECWCRGGGRHTNLFSWGKRKNPPIWDHVTVAYHCHPQLESVL